MSGSRRGRGPSLPQVLQDELDNSRGASSRSGPRSTSLAAQRRASRKDSRAYKKNAPFREQQANKKQHQPRNLAQKPPAQHNTLSQKKQPIRNHNSGTTKEATLSSEHDGGSESESTASSEGSSRASSPSPEPETKPKLSRAIQAQLDDDDAQIAALERKLGKKRSKGGFDSILDELGDLGGLSDSENELRSEGTKRKRDAEADDWLRTKRQKATAAQSKEKTNSIPSGEGDSEDSFDGFDDDDLDGETDDEEADNTAVIDGPSKTPRENPYVAPSSAKYVPPSLRNRSEASQDGVTDIRLQRRLQGALNKLSESNIADIVEQVNQIAREYPRNEVSTTLTNLLLSILAERTALNDTFIVLHAGFIAALCRNLGQDFLARFIQPLVERCDRQAKSDAQSESKEDINLLSTLTELYNFQVITSKLVYDLVALYVDNLTEHSVECLLRIIRNSGQQLRHDDPSTLATIVTNLQASVQELDESKLSVRSRFMIEMITDLRNNRMKASGQGSSIRTEHLLRVKKILASARSTKILSSKPTEPLHVGLDDIRNSQRRGKWWLVGASYRDEGQLREQGIESEDLKSQDQSAINPRKSDLPKAAESIPLDIHSLARSLGMNTDVRRSIFVAIMTAASLDEAYVRIMKLPLSKRQLPEVVTVLSKCAAAEQVFNPYYAALAKRLSGQREIRKALWNPLLELFLRLEAEEEEGGNGGFDSDDSENEEGGARSKNLADAQARFNLAQLFASLMADGVVSLAVLKSRGILSAGSAATAFIELLLIQLFLAVGRKRQGVRKVVLTGIGAGTGGGGGSSGTRSLADGDDDDGDGDGDEYSYSKYSDKTDLDFARALQIFMDKKMKLIGMGAGTGTDVPGTHDNKKQNRDAKTVRWCRDVALETLRDVLG